MKLTYSSFDISLYNKKHGIISAPCHIEMISNYYYFLETTERLTFVTLDHWVKHIDQLETKSITINNNAFTEEKAMTFLRSLGRDVLRHKDYSVESDLLRAIYYFNPDQPPKPVICNYIPDSAFLNKTPHLMTLVMITPIDTNSNKMRTVFDMLQAYIDREHLRIMPPPFPSLPSSSLPSLRCNNARIIKPFSSRMRSYMLIPISA